MKMFAWVMGVAVAGAGLLAATAASAQTVTTYYGNGYYGDATVAPSLDPVGPVIGQGVVQQEPLPAPVTTYYGAPTTTYYGAPATYGAPTTAYYAPSAPVTTYYAPAPAPVTAYYGPAYAPAPVTAYYGGYYGYGARRPYRAYYGAPMVATPGTAYVAPYYAPAPVIVRPKVYYPGQPVRNLFRAITP